MHHWQMPSYHGRFSESNRGQVDAVEQPKQNTTRAVDKTAPMCEFLV
jgi:hypothetical protein